MRASTAIKAVMLCSLVQASGCAQRLALGEIWLPRGEPTPVDIEGSLELSADGLPPHLMRVAAPVVDSEVWIRRDDPTARWVRHSGQRPGLR